MTAVDAQFYWMSAKIPNDQFLLYAFAGVPDDLDAAVADVLDRARRSPELMVRVADSDPLRYPRWVPTAVPLCAVRHQLGDDTWTGCLDAVVRLADDQLDPRCATWRLHVFAPVRGVPGQPGAGAVAVLQVAHALADGVRASALAGWLFGRAEPVAPVAGPRPGFLPRRAVEAAREHRRQVSDIRAGRCPEPMPDRQPLATNDRPAGARTVRTLVRRRSEWPGPTVTVGALAAISAALSQYLGPGCQSLGAEVPMAKATARRANNHFGNVRVGLHPQLPWQLRTERIAADLEAARRRAQHPATRSADRAFAAVPAVLLRWGVSQFDPDLRPARVGGNTVVSSVHRGPADLAFGAAPVVLTAGFPALSPAMALTHGVHGIGDTIVLSVHAAASAIPDVDEYLGLLDARL